MARTRRFALAWTLLGMLAGLSTWPAEAVPFAYVTSANDSTVWVLDTASDAVAIIPLPPSAGPAFGVALGPDGKYAYVTHMYSSTVSVIDTDRNTVVATVPVGRGPSGIAITPDGKFAYITTDTINPGTVSVLDTATHAVETVPVERNCCWQIAITPDGTQAYVANGPGTNTVSVIDTANKRWAATIPVGDSPMGVAITPDGKHAYVTNYDFNTVSVIDTATHAVEMVPVQPNNQPMGVAITPDGKHAYVTNIGSNTVSVIDTATHAVETVPVGPGPRGIAITPDGKYAYVANSNSDTVSVIDTANHAVAPVQGVHSPSNVATFASPVHHVIVVVGENRSFDHVFGVYKPLPGQAVSNLLSKGIVNEDGTPRVVVGENRSFGHVFGYKPLPGQAVSNLLSKGIVNEDGTLSIARQYQTAGQTSYFISADQKMPYDHLPAPQLLGTPNAQSATQPPFLPSPQLANIERDIPASALRLLTTGASGLSATQGIDTRVLNAATLPNGPFQLTGRNLPYDAYTGNPTHRFYQMWQQSDCSVRNATVSNPTGCLNDLYPFVGNTVPPQTSEGGTSMAFLNMLQRDAPYLKALADQYTMSDNHHQAQMGGTTVNHFYLAMADNIYFSDGQGHSSTPPPSAIANPNPQPNTNNRYTNDGLFSNCSDTAQPGVAPIVTYLASLSYRPKPNCEAGHYYLLNNLNPAYKPDGTRNRPDQAIPPTSVRSIGDALNEKGISWAYYGGGYRHWLSGNPQLQLLYCQCNPFEYQSSIMADPVQRAAHLKDTTDLFTDIAAGTLPAVSYVKPDNLISGEPVFSKVDLYEAFVKNLIEQVQANPSLFATTAIFVTFDEGGGYYDSGFIQALDFFGDGPRVPFIAVSPWTKGGRVVHTYSDNASIVKFIERNWGLQPLTARSRDNLPNPRNSPDPYVPSNMPAIDDLFSMFQFSAPQ